MIDPHEGRADLHEMRLTDATDAFDFGVRNPSGDPYIDTFEPGGERFTFTALDGTPRTDTWVSNQQELALGSELDHAPDPWDPDSDDDGLTDGQERHWITQWNASTNWLEWDIGGPDGDSVSNPVDPDTDADGRWDGWIGVHGVGQTARVVLYREHLQNGGVYNDYERVDEQVGYHQVGGATPGTDIDGDGNREHANIHVGERHWGTDPLNDSSTREPSVTLEVDYYEHSDPALDNASLRESIADNYALYGVNVSFVDPAQNTNRNITDSELDRYYISSPFDKDNLTTIKQEFSNTDALYMFVADEFDGNSNPTGARLYPSGEPDNTNMTVLFTDHMDPSKVPSRFNLTRDEKMQSIATKTAVHEIGHVLNTGENDDNFTNGLDEVYSGSDEDDTNETIVDKNGDDWQRWSVMASGHPQDIFIPPAEYKYTAFSIEELFTISLVDVRKNDYD